MDQYCAVDGMPDDWHLVHYGHRALGGAGLVYTEMTCVSPEARISPGARASGTNAAGCVAQDRRTLFMSVRLPSSACRSAIPAARARRSSVGRADQPLTEGNWPIYAPSPLPYFEGISQVPVAMTRADMEQVRDQFVRATRLGLEAGFDMLELHMAHGYLLGSFLSPLTNQRTDDYGGDIQNRLRFPLEYLRPCRDSMARPTSRSQCAFRLPTGPMADCRRATCSHIARAFKEPGVDSHRRVCRADCAVADAGVWPQCGKRRSRTRFATRSASRRWPSAISTSRTT
jgi:anthraniloyl-CoA monooxygenase